MRFVVDSAPQFPPQEPVCPITQEAIKDPVLVGESGSVYECRAVVQWLLRSDRDPCTNLHLRSPRVLRLDPIREAVEHFLEAECRSQGGASGLGIGAAASALRRAVSEARAAAGAAAQGDYEDACSALRLLEERTAQARSHIEETQRVVDEAEASAEELRKALSEGKRWGVRRFRAAALRVLAMRRGSAAGCASTLRKDGGKLVEKAAERLQRWLSSSAEPAAAEMQAGFLFDIVERDADLETDREALVRQVFFLLSQDGERLLEEDLFVYADLCGYRFGRQSWSDEYLAVCGIYGWDPAAGADLPQFARLVDDQGGSGYCTNSELQDLLREVRLVCAGLLPSSDGETTQAPETASEGEAEQERSRRSGGRRAGDGDLAEGHEEPPSRPWAEHDTTEDLELAPAVGTVVEILYEDNVWYRATVAHSEGGRYASVVMERDQEDEVVDLRMHSVRLPPPGGRRGGRGQAPEGGGGAEAAGLGPPSAPDDGNDVDSDDLHTAFEEVVSGDDETMSTVSSDSDGHIY